MQGVYRIRNKINDKRYIGSAQDFDERWDTHRKELRKGNHYNKYLQRAWNRHGEENFVFEVEEEAKGDNGTLLTREQVYLDEGFALGILYNIARKAGGGNLGEEALEKMRQTKQDYFKLHPGHNKGKKYSQKACNKMSAGRLGMTFTQEHKDNIRKSWTPERKKKSSDEWKTWWTSERRKKRSEDYSDGNPNVKSYPAFYNTKTNVFVPAGKNLKKLCNEQNLVYENMRMVARGQTEQTKDGWKLG